MNAAHDLPGLEAMRRAACAGMYAAANQRRATWRAAAQDALQSPAYREWRLIEQACRRELRRLNNRISRVKRAHTAACAAA